MVSEIFDSSRWRPVEGFEFTDMTYHRAVDQGTVRIAFNRPECRNAFRPQTVDELYTALDHARMWSDVGTVLLTGNGPSPKDGGWAFCSGGDQRIRGKDGYKYVDAEGVDRNQLGRLHILEGTKTDSYHAQSRDRRGPGLGSGWRPQSARDLRHDHRQQ